MSSQELCQLVIFNPHILLYQYKLHDKKYTYLSRQDEIIEVHVCKSTTLQFSQSHYFHIFQVNCILNCFKNKTENHWKYSI